MGSGSTVFTIKYTNGRMEAGHGGENIHFRATWQRAGPELDFKELILFWQGSPHN